MVLSDTPDIISDNFLVSCLISIFITEDVINLLGDCYICEQPLELEQIGTLDWQHRLLLHRSSTEYPDCVVKYQEYYLKLNPEMTPMQIRILFGISKRTESRRRSVARR